MAAGPEPQCYVCRAPRLPTPPFADCLAVVCSDGSWHAQVDEFLNSLEAARWDWIALAGGPAALVERFASFREHHTVRHHLRFLVKAHSVRRIALVAHDFCGYYAHKRVGLSFEKARSLQRRHLLLATRTAKRWNPAATTEAYLIRGEPDGKCWVEKVDNATR